ncbi:MAG: response regulator [Proteobacteria bacterium]|nr:response regulator [Pseudomonadota bacterium]
MTTSNIKVLVVDDEEMVRISLADFLEDEGFDVHSASCADDVQEVIQANDFDVAVVDIRLSGEDGNALIQKIHEMRPRIKFLIHTGTTDYSLPVTLHDFGIGREHIFKKPMLDMSSLVKAIRSLFAEER